MECGTKGVEEISRPSRFQGLALSPGEREPWRRVMSDRPLCRISVPSERLVEQEETGGRVWSE